MYVCVCLYVHACVDFVRLNVQWFLIFFSRVVSAFNSTCGLAAVRVACI